MRAAKVDGNHAEIVKALRQAGCAVLSLAKLGNGAPDLLVCYGFGSTTAKPYYPPSFVLMEVKKGKGKLRPAQVGFHSRWPVSTVRSVDEALAAIGVGRVSGAPEPRG